MSRTIAIINAMSEATGLSPEDVLAGREGRTPDSWKTWLREKAIERGRDLDVMVGSLST